MRPPPPHSAYEEARPFLRLLLTIVGTGLAWSPCAHAGPWVRDAGGWYGKASYGLYRSAGYVDATGLTQDGAYTGHSAAVYGEVGLGAGFQAVVYAPWTLGLTSAGSNQGVGDCALGLTWSQSDAAVPWSLHLGAKLPAYDDWDLPSTRPALGDGQVDLTARGSMGISGSRHRAGLWALAELGFVHRTEWTLTGHSPAGVYGNGVDYRVQGGLQPGTGERPIWLAVDQSGREGFVPDGFTREWHQTGFAAGWRIVGGLSLEVNGAWTWYAVGSGTGAQIGVGLAHTRE